MAFQVVATLSNVESLCIGEITREEADLAQVENPLFDGFGIYLVSVDARNPKAPGEVLAKFSSEDAARKLAALFRLSGRLEAA